ncbi:MAG TPA: UDP-N-acetylglucosamine--N-acetylmuramyl-(pentapeptide) pyrophosphoryl-undecaprenol N-acetylglucosamine transferase [Gemmatimonadaceae bacterium]|nr:UDP-N-acetylglucosamine--N-acetylmuramyl-(pentapeptide) pyrophosphoryl-undecaprenol N-acetylglucosamine transferase [Gemmatimonadaceae bacterium]
MTAAGPARGIPLLFAGGGTGGHLYPGLAIARALCRAEPAVHPVFVGARRGIERDVLPTTEFPHVLLDLHPLYRARPWENWRTAVGLAGAWRRIGAIAREQHPRAAVATGGYASGAVLAYAAAHGIPTFIQESNSHPGLTTRVFARFAREVHLGYPEAAALLPRGRARVVDTGNPIEPPPVRRPDPRRTRASWELPADGRVMLVVGGSQGARAINDAVLAWITAGLPDGVHVIWSTGRQGHERYRHVDGPRVKVRPYLQPITEAYATSDFALCRAGAMTTSELCAWGIPSILVPLPTAAADHQTKNAVALAASGAARMVSQAELTAARLAAEVADMLRGETLAHRASKALERARPDAAETIARRILTALDLKQLHS